ATATQHEEAPTPPLTPLIEELLSAVASLCRPQTPGWAYALHRHLWEVFYVQFRPGPELPTEFFDLLQNPYKPRQRDEALHARLLAVEQRLSKSRPAGQFSPYHPSWNEEESR